MITQHTFYKQLHGTAMGSPVSGVVAEIIMQNIKQQALATYKQTLPLWLRHGDNTFTAVHKDKIKFLHEHLNKQNTYIQFTREIEENSEIPFLDCLVSHDNKKQRSTENQHTLTAYSTNVLITPLVTKRLLYKP